MPEKLDANRFNQLNRIFLDQGWDINEDENNLFIRFSERLAKLEPEDQDFVLKITEHYRVYGLEDYEKMLQECLVKMNQDSFFETSKKIIVAPLLEYNKSPEKNVKSSNLMCYLMKSNQLSYLGFLTDVDIEVFSFLNETDLSEIRNKKIKLLLLDDYIGSGGTAKKTIKTFTAEGLHCEDITVLSLLIDPRGENVLNDLKIKFYKSNRDYYQALDIFEDEVKLNMHLNRIKKKIKATESYKSGYSKTRALLSLIRTPNNTLPFYWWEKPGKIAAPFPRFNEKKVK